MLGQGSADQIRDRRMPDRLDIVPPDRQLVELQHLPRGVVHELQPPLRIDDDDAFDHAGQDRFHAAAVSGELAQPPAELLHRLVERSRHLAELVVAVVQARRGQVAPAIAFGNLGDCADAVSEASGRERRDERGAGERQLRALRASWRIACSCRRISVSGSATRTKAMAGCRTGTATYSMSILSVAL